VTRVVNTKVGAGWVVLDVLGGLIPVIVDAATGDWKKLDQDAVNAVLEKQK
jgi:glycerol-3-phosphate acyltransferase PlsY